MTNMGKQIIKQFNLVTGRYVRYFITSRKISTYHKQKKSI